MVHTTKKAVEFLRNIDRNDLAALLRFSTAKLVGEPDRSGPSSEVIEIVSPPPFDEALRGLSEWEQQRILDALAKTAAPGTIEKALRLRFATSTASVSSGDALIAELFIHQNDMIAVSTGSKVPIQQLNDYYRSRHKRISAALSALSLEHPNPHGDLWDFYKKWSADLPSWKERRRYVRELYGSLVEHLIATPVVVPVREPTGWERVDRTIETARERLATAKHEEDFQTVGLLCREGLISLGQEVFDPTTHTTEDGVVPSVTDGGRMIEAFLRSVIGGGSAQNVRKHARASLNLAVELQHKRTADFRAAALCLEATSSITSIVAILSGRHDPVPPLA